MRLALLIVLVLSACSGEAADAKAPAPATTAPACRHDQDCTGAWNPGVDGCGPVDRCVEGACRVPAAITGVADATTGRIAFATPAGEKAYGVELVSHPFETARGLMCRDAMKPDWGMLFLLETRVQRFWMKNTLIPLDMIFLDDAWKVVGVVSGAQPRTLTSRGVDAPSRYVLELVDGEAARAGIAAGVQARFYPPRR